MEDEELIQELSKTWSTDSWDQVLSYKQLFKDINNYYKYISNNSYGRDLCEVWNKFKNDWRLIQRYLPMHPKFYYRICPICGEIPGKLFKYHLFNHNLSIENYVCLLNNLSEVPKCLNPNCNNKVILDRSSGGYTFRKYCSQGCNTRHKSILGLHNFQSQNILRNSEGKSIKNIKSNITRIHNGNHNWYNPECYESNYISGWHSYAENLLGDLLFQLNIYYTRELWINTPYGLYRVDYWLPDFNLVLECDGDYKWNNGILDQYYIDRARNIEITKHCNVLNLKESDIKYKYYYNKRELWRLIKTPKYQLIKFNSI